MAKTSAIQKNLKRMKLVKKYAKKRAALKKIIKNKKLELSERFAAQLKLNKLPEITKNTGNQKLPKITAKRKTKNVTNLNISSSKLPPGTSRNLLDHGRGSTRPRSVQSHGLLFQRFR